MIGLSRFHLLAEFDDIKRSCRRRLAAHNKRRRKPHFTSESGESKGLIEVYKVTRTSSFSGTDHSSIFLCCLSAVFAVRQCPNIDVICYNCIF